MTAPSQNTEVVDFRTGEITTTDKQLLNELRELECGIGAAEAVVAERQIALKEAKLELEAAIDKLRDRVREQKPLPLFERPTPAGFDRTKD